MPEQAVFQITAIVVLGVCAQWAAWRLSLPSILLLLITGMLIGPVTGFLDPGDLLGDLLFPVVSIAVALILYEGGLTLNLRELREVGGVVRNIISIGALVTWASASGAAMLLFDMPVEMALLLGAILVVTGPTVIGPLLRHIRPTGPVGAILKWEGIVIDPIGASLAVLVFEAIAGEHGGHAGAIALAVGKTIVFGGGSGLLAGMLLALVIARHWAPEFLENAVSLMLVVAAFVAANAVQEESGLLAVTVMGVYLANQKHADVRHIVEFKENLRVLLISALFILLSARLKIADVTAIGASGAAFAAILIFVGRPLSVFGATIGSKLATRERLFLAWMAPRGIVAAAVSSLFALRLEDTSYAEPARLLAPLTFVTIIVTVAVYGLTSPWLARRLGVAEPNPQGVLIVGAHDWARAIAKLLYERGVRVLLVDTNWDNIAAARMEGLPTYAGSILSEHAIDELELGGIGRVLALTPNDWVNVLTMQRFQPLFGRKECYQLPPGESSERVKQAHRHLQARWAFSETATFADLQRRAARGQTLKATKLTDEFGLAEFRQRYGDDALPLFRHKGDGRLEIITADGKVEPKPGDTLIAMVDAQEAAASA
ncbi:MAG: hypothetical protein D6744_16390 [Planctomycetota bacterium]|nr:MAG: hypothetical protein D6744_16390 [Planctomycetota bacterium]